MNAAMLNKDEREDLMEELDLSPQVRRGIALLDEQVPDWLDRIDVPDLDLADCKHCTLGQTFYEEWALARAEYRADHPDEDMPWSNPFLYGTRALKVDYPMEHGFDECLDPEELGYTEARVKSRSYYELTEEWATYVLRVRNN